jgi:hypothetical protein
MKNIKGLNAYPIFIMWEQLNLNNFFEDQSLDEMWEDSCMEYEMFKRSKYDDEFQSEYDCITQYVKSLTTKNLKP